MTFKLKGNPTKSKGGTTWRENKIKFLSFLANPDKKTKILYDKGAFLLVREGVTPHDMAIYMVKLYP